ncbi:ATP-binding protein [Streptomyces sp. SP18BB07]|uniref:ATP-binding protein n=1 Tax=Streptomyces sp. SP18BB07 TaxID=3002522 RepID=UPI002E77A118|nr:ATP-binding protein [Streptomyces sp. SP18BB07]MEE1760970.1 ATP-binding protein [Streptomyces sp. SP18BB07]
MGLADRLAAARDGGLVGREPERAVLDRMLSGAPDAPLVVYLHGPGGIGKSSLVRYAARQAELIGRRVVHVDGRFLDADPRRLEEAAALACAEPGAVLLIDTFEQCQPLEAWLRESFLPRLADHAVVVVAGRVAPDAEWSLDPGWAQLFTALAVRPLDAAQSHALLAARGVPAEQRGAFVAFAGGSPLALSLAASVPAATPGALWEPAGDVLTTLVERLVGDLPSAVHRRALEVVAQAYVTREPLLRAVLGDEDTDTVFSWLRQLPYIEASPEGLHPHDAVRATLEADLRWRDPERYDDIRVRVSLAGLRAVRGAADDDALLRVAEWMFLFRHQGGSGNLYNHRTHPHIEDTPLRPEDVPGVLRMAEEAEGPESAAAVAHWLRRQPEAFRVHRYAGSCTPVSFMAVLRLDAPLPEDRAADPVIAAVWGLVEAAAPLGPGEHLGIRRFAVQAGGRQRPSPLMELTSRRTIAEEMRAHGRAVTFTVFEDADRWGRYLAEAGMPELAAVDVDGRHQHIFGRDWRRQTVEEWVRHRARATVTPVATWPTTASASGPGHQLSRAAFEEGALEALRTWHTPRAFATSVLLHSHLVPPGSSDPTADLRGAILTALDALQTDPAGVKAHEALTTTYITAPRTHRAAARRLGVPYGTYRRHLALAKERLTEQLLRQPATPSTPIQPQSLPQECPLVSAEHG